MAYVKQTFTTGQVLTADHMNHIEEGITAVEAGMPKKLSEMDNDVDYLTQVPEEYVTEEELSKKGYLTKVPDGYVTMEQAQQLAGSLATQKVSLPTENGEASFGTAGQFAVSDGKGGITWLTVVDCSEVAF